MAPRPSTTARAALAIAVAALLVACSTVGPSPTSGPSPSLTSQPSGPAAIGSPVAPSDAFAVYAAIAGQVEAIRGLQPTTAISPTLITPEQLRANLQTDFDRNNPPAALALSEHELVALGLLPPGTSLRQAVLDLEAGQVAGYYSPHEHQLFVVSRSGGIGPTQRSTYAHEFTHELQDQNFHLGRLDLSATDQGDRSLARLSLVEGDAVSVQTTWMQQQLTPAELGQIFADAADPAAIDALRRAPPALRSTTLFPYQDGLAFVMELLGRGGYALIDQAFSRPPASTEQILHLDKYLADEIPATVRLPDGLAVRLGAGWSNAGSDTLGEFTLSLWLRQGGVATPTATAAAAGWGGDRIEVFVGPNGGLALALLTEWDTTADAAEFAAAAPTALGGLGLVGRLVHAAGSKRVSIAIGPDSSTATQLSAGLP